MRFDIVHAVRQRYPQLHAWSERTTRRLVRAIRQLKGHSNPWVRRGLGFGLILGGVLAFLPILGVWMLPLGLVILSDESTRLRRPRRRLQIWLGRRFPKCRIPSDQPPASPPNTIV